VIEISNSLISIRKFLSRFFDSSLSVEIYCQLVKCGGNTVKGLMKLLKADEIRASKSSVYYSIEELKELGLIERISPRPPMYIAIQEKELFEELAVKDYLDTREELMKRWAISYPFLPDRIKKSSESSIQKISGQSIVSFNPYPIVNTYSSSPQDFEQYLRAILDSTLIQGSIGILDMGLGISFMQSYFGEYGYTELLKILERNHFRKGRTRLQILSRYVSEAIYSLAETLPKNKAIQKLFEYMDYEIRYPKSIPSSYVLSTDKLFLPVGLKGKICTVYSFFEIRDNEIIIDAERIFQENWGEAKVMLKIQDGKVIIKDELPEPSGLQMNYTPHDFPYLIRE
jgi:hypothetical protein